MKSLSGNDVDADAVAADVAAMDAVFVVVVAAAAAAVPAVEEAATSEEEEEEAAPVVSVVADVGSRSPRIVER